MNGRARREKERINTRSDEHLYFTLIHFPCIFHQVKTTRLICISFAYSTVTIAPVYSIQFLLKWKIIGSFAYHLTMQKSMATQLSPLFFIFTYSSSSLFSSASPPSHPFAACLLHLLQGPPLPI